MVVNVAKLKELTVESAATSYGVLYIVLYRLQIYLFFTTQPISTYKRLEISPTWGYLHVGSDNCCARGDPKWSLPLEQVRKWSDLSSNLTAWDPVLYAPVDIHNPRIMASMLHHCSYNTCFDFGPFPNSLQHYCTTVPFRSYVHCQLCKHDRCHFSVVQLHSFDSWLRMASAGSAAICTSLINGFHVPQLPSTHLWCIWWMVPMCPSRPQQGYFYLSQIFLCLNSWTDLDCPYVGPQAGCVLSSASFQRRNVLSLNNWSTVKMMMHWLFRLPHRLSEK